MCVCLCASEKQVKMHNKAPHFFFDSLKFIICFGRQRAHMVCIVERFLLCTEAWCLGGNRFQEFATLLKK